MINGVEILSEAAAFPYYRKKIEVSQEEYIKVIIREVETELDVENLLKNNRTRQREFAEARQLAITLLVSYTMYNYNEIALIFEKDHCTVNHCIKKVTDRISIEKGYKIKVQKVIAVLNAIFQRSITIHHLLPRHHRGNSGVELLLLEIKFNELKELNNTLLNSEFNTEELFPQLRSKIAEIEELLQTISNTRKQ